MMDRGLEGPDQEGARWSSGGGVRTRPERRSMTARSSIKGVVSQLCVHGSLPYRLPLRPDRPGEECIAWARHSDQVTVCFTSGIDCRQFQRAHPRSLIENDARPCGLPYGSYPRLLLAWLATEVARTGSANVELGSSVAQFFEKLGLVPTGGIRGTITAVKDQLNRLMNATIKVQNVGDAAAWECRHMVVGRQHSPGSEGWWKAAEGTQRALWQPQIELSAEFFRLLRMDPVEIDLSVINALARSPLAIDVYFWSRFQSSRLEPATPVEWNKLFAQFGGQSARHKFVENFKRAALSVSTVDSRCGVVTGRHGAWVIGP